MIRDIPIELIDPSRFETREKIEPLESSQSLGVLEVLLVRQKPGGKYELVAGHRRLASLKARGETTALCRVVEMNDEQAALALFKENSDRKDLTDFEWGEFFKKYMGAFGLSLRETAAKLGVDPATVSRCIAITESARAVLEPTNRITSESFAQAVTENKFKEAVKIKDEQKRVQVLAQVAEHNLSTRETQTLVSRVRSGEAPGKAANELLLQRERAKSERYTGKKRGLTSVHCSSCGIALIIAHEKDGGHRIQVLRSEGA